jgi:hypothetical protein
MDMFLTTEGKRLVGPVTDGADKVTVATLIWDCGQWYGVESTNLDALYHDGDNLYVRFTKGAVYRYSGVPVGVAFDLLKSESVGKAFNANIKPFYVCEKISG